MYLPAHFREDDPAALRALMDAHPLATLVSVIDGAPFVSHVPLIAEEREGGGLVLRGHVARANPHHRAWEGGAEALAIFHGPGAYISPTLYDNEESVPTWNYTVVHARGVPLPLRAEEDAERLHALMKALIARFEPSYAAQWDRLSEKYRAGMLRGIVGFEMPVAHLAGKFKGSQNRSTAERARIAEATAGGTPPRLFT